MDEGCCGHWLMRYLGLCFQIKCWELKRLSFQGYFIYWECLNLEIHSIDNTAGLKFAASDSAQIWLSASRESTKSLSSS